MKANYHTHTSYCPHARGAAEAYVQQAIAAGYDELGFADHCPWPLTDYKHPGMRMEVEDFPHYVADIRALREKYADRISIRIGLECEYFPDHMDWLKKLIADWELDYVIFGNHFYPIEGPDLYIGDRIKLDGGVEHARVSSLRGMEAGIYAYMAHPEVFMNGVTEWQPWCSELFRDICRKAVEVDLPLEYNLLGARYNGIRGRECYPHHAFWEIAGEMGCKAIMGVDAHDPEDFLLQEETRAQAERFLRSVGVQLLDRLPFPDRV